MRYFYTSIVFRKDKNVRIVDSSVWAPNKMEAKRSIIQKERLLVSMMANIGYIVDRITVVEQKDIQRMKSK